MDEIRLECRACGAQPRVPMSDHYELPSLEYTETGEVKATDPRVVDASQLALPDGRVVTWQDMQDPHVADAVRDYLQGLPCPHCGHDQMRMTM